MVHFLLLLPGMGTLNGCQSTHYSIIDLNGESCYIHSISIVGPVWMFVHPFPLQLCGPAVSGGKGTANFLVGVNPVLHSEDRVL
jgi:hypothetical protein